MEDPKFNKPLTPEERERTADEVFSEIKDDVRELSKTLENQPDNEKIKKYIELNNIILGYMFEEKTMDGKVSHETLQALGQAAQNVAPAPAPEIPPIPEMPTTPEASTIQSTTPTSEQVPSVELGEELANQPKASVEALISDLPKPAPGTQYPNSQGVLYSTPEEARASEPDDWRRNEN